MILVSLLNSGLLCICITNFGHKDLTKNTRVLYSPQNKKAKKTL